MDAGIHSFDSLHFVQADHNLVSPQISGGQLMFLLTNIVWALFFPGLIGIVLASFRVYLCCLFIWPQARVFNA